MIRGAKHVAVACRRPGADEEGKPINAPDTPIFVETERVSTFASRASKKFAPARWPFVRGAFVLLESMELGSKGLRLSTRVAMEPPARTPDTDAGSCEKNSSADASAADQTRPLSAAEPIASAGGVPAPQRSLQGALWIAAAAAAAGAVYWARNTGRLSAGAVLGISIAVGLLALIAVIARMAKQEEARDPGALTLSGIAVGATMVVGLTLGISIFFLLPSLVAGLFHRYLNAWELNLVEGVIRVALFFAYLTWISRMPNIRRLFQYHGAEHQVIHAHEHGLELVPESAEKFSTIHPRCGTAFLAIVLVISVVIFAFAGWQVWWERLLVRVGGLPLIAGVSYELLKLNSRGNNRFLAALTAPGLWFQRITTQPPSRDQVEVAIAAMRGVLDAEAADIAH